MTHDELLAKIESFNKITSEGMERKALRAVVELHKPYKMASGDIICDAICNDENGYAYTYPCKTIQAIERELN